MSGSGGGVTGFLTPTPYLTDPDLTLYVGDALEVLRTLPDGSVDCCVTSPPYWNLRDYGTGTWEGGDPECDHVAKAGTPAVATGLGYPADGGPRRVADGNTYHGAYDAKFRDVCGKCGARRVDRQLGLEPTPDAYVAAMVTVFREVRRVLADHGTCWINLGDSYASSGVSGPLGKPALGGGGEFFREHGVNAKHSGYALGRAPTPAGLKPKDLVGIPWMVAFALRADGWYLRSDIIWSKPNPMPESVTDRPTKAHEYVFLLSKSPRYWFDQEAVREPHSPDGRAVTTRTVANGSHANYQEFGHEEGRERWPNGGRNIRSVWTIATQPYPEAHFATFPEELPRRCILAGCPEWVCRVCGKPRERMTEREPNAFPGSSHDHTEDLTGPGAQRHASGKPAGTIMAQRFYAGQGRTTLGWSDCGHADYRPGIVLDPFGGAGTTALVARKHGRRSILIELNETYARMAAERLSQLSLLAEAPVPPTYTDRPRGLTGGAYSPPGQSPHSNARSKK